MQPRIVEVRQNILKQNDLLARELRRRACDAGVYVVNVVSGPGTGKTALLEATLTMMRDAYRVAALTGDLATDNDARRLAKAGVPVRQISTGTVCHLDAAMVERAQNGWDLASLDFLFIENVGNLVCPASYDLGEQLRVVLFSVTEGEDKPLKYPTIFNTADLAVLTKDDLADAVAFDREAAYTNVREVRPGLPILATSVRTGSGVTEWVAYLEALAGRSRSGGRGAGTTPLPSMV